MTEQPAADVPEAARPGTDGQSRVQQAGVVLLRAWPHAVAAVVALAAALWTYRPWAFGSSISSPGGDALAFDAWVQNIVESGWYENGPRLAAPFMQNNHSYSVTDEALFAFVGKILVPLTGSVGAAVGWVVILSFPLAAVLAVVAARSLRISRASSVLVGVAFALLPDHFIRGTGHYSLAQSWVIPIGVVAATSLVHPFTGSPRRRRVIEAVIIVGCVMISLVNAYYAVFAGLLVVAAALGSWRQRGFRVTLLPTVLRGAALALPLGLAMWLDKRFLPSPLGFPSIDITRSAADVDVYGGKLLAMLLPASAHRNETLASIRNSYDTTFPNPAEGPALGLVASVAFVALMIWALLYYWKPSTTPRAALLGTLAALTWVSVICYTVGGVGELWAFVLNGGGLRAWSRMHVVIALLALLAAGVALDAVRRVPLRWGLVAVLTVLAIVEQTSPVYRPDPVRATAMQAEVEDLTAAIDELAPEGAAIYQYPDVSFAVSLRNTAPASAYDGFLPYLYSSPDLRWSYGGLQGDPRADWQTTLGTRPMSQQAALLQAAGFAGVLVDTAALTADPDALAAARAALGAPAVTSSSGRWEYYVLDGTDATCRGGATDLSDEALRPPILYPGTGFRPSGNVLINDVPGAATLRVLTLRDEGWPRTDLWFTVDVPAGGLRVTWPDGRTEVLSAGTQEVHWSGALPSTETEIGIERLDSAGTPFLVHGFRSDVGTGADAEACMAELAGVS